MQTLYFQGRGPLYLQEINADGTLKAAIAICPDALALNMSANTWTHTNKCGAVDVEDARGTNSLAASFDLTFANMEDKLFALGALGTLNLAGSPGTVTVEHGPDTIAVGDIYFLGGKTRHRAITALVVTDTSSPTTVLVANTDYTLDAPSGKVTFLTGFTGPPNFAYGYTDPQSVTLLNAAVKDYFASYEFMNRQAANDPGSLELYKVRFDPATGLDFLSDKEQSMALKGSALADTSRAVDGALGQFGRRVL